MVLWCLVFSGHTVTLCYSLVLRPHTLLKPPGTGLPSGGGSRRWRTCDTYRFKNESDNFNFSVRSTICEVQIESIICNGWKSVWCMTYSGSRVVLENIINRPPVQKNGIKAALIDILKWHECSWPQLHKAVKHLSVCFWLYDQHLYYFRSVSSWNCVFCAAHENQKQQQQRFTNHLLKMLNK